MVLPAPERGLEGAGCERILVAGVGNVLRRDDGFGVAVARRLLEQGALPPGVVVLEAGIAGVRVVQELMAGYDGLIVVDAVQRGGPAGTLYELQPPPVTLDPADAPTSLHIVEPSRVLMLAQAAGCLPPRVRIVGCEPADYDEMALELSPAVAAAVEPALDLVRRRIADWYGGVAGAPAGGGAGVGIGASGGTEIAANGGSTKVGHLIDNGPPEQ